MNNEKLPMSSISCIIPTHDRLDLLKIAVLSVLVQSLKPAEIIIVDDIGMDDVKNFVESISQEHHIKIRYLDSSHYGNGASASRNFGANHSEGSIVTFLDDDDEWDPEFLQLCYAIMHDEKTDFVVSWAWFDNGEIRKPGQSITAGLLSSDCFWKNPGLTGSNFLISKDAYLKIGGFDETLSVSNDRDFVIRLLDSGASYSVVKQRLVSQKTHSLGHLSSRTARRASGLERFYSKYKDRLSIKDKRYLCREIWSVKRFSSNSAFLRAYFTILQALTYSPVAFAKKVLERSRTSRSY